MLMHSLSPGQADLGNGHRPVDPPSHSPSSALGAHTRGPTTPQSLSLSRSPARNTLSLRQPRRRRSGSKYSPSGSGLTLQTPHERLQAAAPQVHLLRASIQRHIHLWYAPASLPLHSQGQALPQHVAPQSNLSSEVAALMEEMEAIANASWSKHTSSPAAAEHLDMDLLDQMLTQLEFLKRVTALLDSLLDLDMLAQGVQLDRAALVAASLGQQVRALATQSHDLGHCLDPAVFPFLAEAIALHVHLLQDRLQDLSSRFFSFSTDTATRKAATTRKLTVTYEIPLDPPPATPAPAATGLSFDPPEPELTPIALSTVLDALAHLDLLDTHLSTLVDKIFTDLLDPLADASDFHRVQWHAETLAAHVRVHSDTRGPAGSASCGGGSGAWHVHLDLVARGLQALGDVLQHRGLLECIDRVLPAVQANVSRRLVPLVLDGIVLAHVPDDDAGAVAAFAHDVASALVGFRDRVAATGVVAEAALDEMCAGVQLAQAVHVRRRRGRVVLAATQVLCSRDANVVKVVENADLVHFKNAGLASKAAGRAGAQSGGVVLRNGATTTSHVPNADPAGAGSGLVSGTKGGKLGASGDLLGIDLTHWDQSSSTPLMDLSLARLPNYLVTTQTHALLEMMTDLVQRHAPHPYWDHERDAPAALEAYEHVHDLVLLWMAVVPALRGHSLRTSPRAAALFRNDAECLLHHLVTLPAKVRCGIPAQWMPPATLMDLAPGVVRAGNAVFKDMMINLHTQFQAHLDALGDLNDLYLDTAFDQAQVAVQDMLDHLDRLDQAWKHCLPDDLYLRALGSLLDGYFSGLVARLLDHTSMPHVSKRNSHALRFVLMQALHVEPCFALTPSGVAGGLAARQQPLAVAPQVAKYCPAYIKVVELARLLSALSLVQGRGEAGNVSSLGRDEALSFVERREY